jgi:hypothetical protein
MELTRRGKFVTPFFGSAGYLEGDEIVRGWLDSRHDVLQHPKMLPVKKAMDSDKELAKMLKVFNTDETASPIIGDWMLFRCSINAAKLAGTWYNFKVSKEKWMNSVRFSPMHVTLHDGDGSKKEEADGMQVFPTKGSFFTAYQFINAGVTFEFTITIADDLVLVADKVYDEDSKKSNTEYIPDFDKMSECVGAVLDKMQMVGLGAFRERFGKFIFIE